MLVNIVSWFCSVFVGLNVEKAARQKIDGELHEKLYVSHDLVTIFFSDFKRYFD